MIEKTLTIVCLLDENTEVEKTFYEDEFDQVTEFLENNLGYEGEAWDVIKNLRSLESLQEFLDDDGIDAFLD